MATELKASGQVVDVVTAARQAEAREAVGGAIVDLVKAWVQKLIENADKIDEAELEQILSKAQEVYVHAAAGETLKAAIDAIALIKIVRAALAD